ncbi:MAG TPA: hypothetical protein VEO91_12425 [Candidatus Limnocylindria bacterium]|nr:hypothetical protein [Candidatus Limnocylindria bacterium]
MATPASELGPAVDSASNRPSTGPLELGIPITERILRRLPGPRWVLITLWAAAVLVTPFVIVGAKWVTGPRTEFDILGELAPQTVLSYVVALLLCGVARLVDQATAIRADVQRLADEESQPGEAAHRWNVAGPVALSAVVVLVVSWSSWSLNGVVPTLVVLPFLALAVLPVMTFVWTYVRLLMGLDQLGRARLELHPFPQDRSLGLGVVGSLAFGGFALLGAAAVPTLIATTRNPTTFFITAVILGVNLPIFFLSMWRLHLQMSGAKERYVGEARALYAAAYEPLRIDSSLSVLRTQAPVLDAARALEERAQRIQAWPINEGLIAIMGFVVAGVTSGIVVRFIVVAASL